MQTDTQIPWYNNFPSPRSTVLSMTHLDVAELLTSPLKEAGKDFLIVDVRRTDFEVITPEL